MLDKTKKEGYNIFIKPKETVVFTMRDFETEVRERVAFIRNLLKEAHADGIVYGNSGGKDCTLVGALCKLACENTVGVIMPCSSNRNYGSDRDDAIAAGEKFGIEQRTVDLTPVREALLSSLDGVTEPNKQALTNIAPRLRMTTLYAIGAAENRLVAGTGNKCEIFMGYFTKWGDGGSDFNPIADLTVEEVYALLDYLGAPENIIRKPPSAGLFEGQTDEADMGVTYAAVADYMAGREVSEQDRAIIERYHARSEHKRRLPKTLY